jgi:mRNA turnover protein 4
MPKSRRDKVVALTQTKKKDREWKGGLIESVREALDEYSGVFVFRCVNLRNNTFKDMKADLKDTSKFFMGSNKVLQVALGKGPEDEQREGLHQLSAHVRGHSGVVFTNLTKEDLETALDKYKVNDYARTGTVAPTTITIEKGPVHGPHGGLMEHTMEPTLRKNGMPTKLNRGVIELLADHVVCTEGEHVSPQGAILLRLFGHELATFELELVCGWVRNLERRAPPSPSDAPSLVPRWRGSPLRASDPSMIFFLARRRGPDSDSDSDSDSAFASARSSRPFVLSRASAVTTNRCGWLRRLATGKPGTYPADKKRHPFP